MTLYTWAPEPVRHLFRAARFGEQCAHGVQFRRGGNIVWAGACGLGGACDGNKIGVMFALGDYREVKGFV